MELSVEIGLLIEQEFEASERRKADAKIVFESFNEQVEKMKSIVKKEDLVRFMREESSKQRQYEEDE